MSNGRAWTADEDALIAQHYGRRGGPARLTALLPHRTPAAIQCRSRSVATAHRRVRRWTSREDRTLTLSWGDAPRTLRAKLPGRSWVAIVQRARVLDLPRVARVEGQVSIAEAARVCGYSHETLVAILHEEGVDIEHYHGGVHAERRVQGRARRGAYAVDLDEVREAVARYIARTSHTETIVEAARRYGTNRDAMRAAVDAAGLLPATTRRVRAYRLDPTAVDGAWAAWCSGRVQGPGLARCAPRASQERAA